MTINEAILLAVIVAVGSLIGVISARYASKKKISQHNALIAAVTLGMGLPLLTLFAFGIVESSGSIITRLRNGLATVVYIGVSISFVTCFSSGIAATVAMRCSRESG